MAEWVGMWKKYLFTNRTELNHLNVGINGHTVRHCIWPTALLILHTHHKVLM